MVDQKAIRKILKEFIQTNAALCFIDGLPSHKWAKRKYLIAQAKLLRVMLKRGQPFP